MIPIQIVYLFLKILRLVLVYFDDAIFGWCNYLDISSRIDLMLISFLPVVIISFFGWFMVHLFNFIQVKSCISGWGPHNGASEYRMWNKSSVLVRCFDFHYNSGSWIILMCKCLYWENIKRIYCSNYIVSKILWK